MNAPDWLDGREQARPVDLGPGVFETMRLVDGRMRRLERHLARLERGARAHGFALRGDECEQLERYIAAHSLRDGVVRLALEPGAKGEHVHISLSARAARSVPAEGVTLLLVDAPRLPLDPDCVHKRTRRGLYELALARARVEGAFDALLLDPTGQAVECATANLHARIDGLWWSPAGPQGALPGLEREEFLARVGPVREAAIPLSLLRQADAVRLTNSVLGEVEVSAIRGVWTRNRTG